MSSTDQVHGAVPASASDKVLVTCALTGVLTDPAQHPVPVSVAEMAAEARRAADAGASVVHLHFRDPRPGQGHLPSWDPEVAGAVADAIRAACPGLILNFSTGVVGRDIAGPVACLERGRPEMAALNAGSLNYLKVREGGRGGPGWAWPPMLFDNPVPKVEAFAGHMKRLGIIPECECFDTGILRSVDLFRRVGMLADPVHISLVMGVQSGMPARASWLPLLVEEMPPAAEWQAILIGRADIWPVHQRVAELGGHLRTGLEDTFYLPDGGKAAGNGPLVEALVRIARSVGREPMSIEEARAHLKLGPA